MSLSFLSLSCRAVFARQCHTTASATGQAVHYFNRLPGWGEVAALLLFILTAIFPLHLLCLVTAALQFFINERTKALPQPHIACIFPLTIPSIMQTKAMMLTDVFKPFISAFLPCGGY
jgi:hypothetical protein